jgi:hypothetical protein
LGLWRQMFGMRHRLRLAAVITLLVACVVVVLTGTGVGEYPYAEGSPVGAGYSNISEPIGTAIVVAASDSPDRSESECDYVCDGTDDHVEIQAAIDGLPGDGGRVTLLGGTYTIRASITLCNGLILEGQGRRNTKIEVARPADIHGIVGPGSSTLLGCVVRDLQVYGRGYGSDYHCIHAKRVDSCVFEGLMLFEGKAGICFEAAASGGSCYRNIVRDTRTYNCKYGIYLEQETGASYQPNANRFENCYVYGGDIAEGVGYCVNKGYHNQWVGGVVTNCATGIRLTASDQLIEEPYVQSCGIGIYARVSQLRLIRPHYDDCTINEDFGSGLGVGSFVYREDELLDLTDHSFSNEALNGSFEMGCLGWDATAYADVSEETATVYSGFKSLKVTARSDDQIAAARQVLDHRVSDFAGKRVTLRGMVYAPSSNGTELARIAVNWGKGDIISAAVPKDDSWHEVTVRGTVSSSASQLSIVLYVYGTRNVAQDTAFFDDIELTVGDMSPSYTDSPMPYGVQCIRSTTLDLTGSPKDVEVYHALTAQRLWGAVALYTGESSRDAGVKIRLGRYGDGVAFDSSYFLSATSEADRNKGYAKVFNPDDFTRLAIGAGDTVTAGTAGGKGGYGQIVFFIYVYE